MEATQQDIDNAAMRREIADRFRAEWDQVYRWALGKFGPGWNPACHHFLVSKSEEEKHRATGSKIVAAATVYTVKNDAGDRKHFTVLDGQVVECASYEEGFGEMILEPDLERTIEARGQQVHPHKYSLCFAPYELYTPMSPEKLAELRISRERGKVERAEKAWKEANPLLVWGDFQGHEQPPE